MKLATRRSASRDGELLIVSRDLKRALSAKPWARHLQGALDDWTSLAPKLQEQYDLLNRDRVASFELDFKTLLAPLPRAYQFLDGSAYLNHVELARAARGESIPPDAHHNPLMYQGLSHRFEAWNHTIPSEFTPWGCDFEAEIAVISADIQRSWQRNDPGDPFRLIMLINDVSLRELIPDEFAKGFGFLQAKPACSCSPVAITLDECGEHWRDHKLDLTLQSSYNGEVFGKPNAACDMEFDYATLLEHAAKTRELCAGTVLGAGTVSNRDPSTGSSCIAERRMRQKIAGQTMMSFMAPGDTIKIEVFNDSGLSLFGAIEQRVAT